MPDIPQSERRGDKLAVTYYNNSTGDYELRPLLGGGDGSAHVIDGIISIGGDSTVVSLPGGSHVAQAVTAGTLYEIDSDVDLYVKPSGSPAVVGWESDNTDVIENVNANLGSIDAWDFGTDSFTYEFWGTVAADVANDPRFIAVGSTSPLFAPRATINGATTYIKPKLIIKDGAGANLLGVAEFNFADITGVGVGPEVRHFTFVIDRTAEEARLFLDGVQIEVASYTDSGGTLNMSDYATAVAEIVLGGTQGRAPTWDGVHYAHRFYKQALTTTQVAARTDAGPNELAQDGVIPSAILNLSSYSRWADPLIPEWTAGAIADGRIVEGAAILVTDGLKSGGDLELTAWTGSNPASASNSKRVRAGQPQKVYATGDYLNLYSSPSASGNVILTPIG